MGEISVPITSQLENWSAKSLQGLLVSTGAVGPVWNVHGPETCSSSDVNGFLEAMLAWALYT